MRKRHYLLGATLVATAILAIGGGLEVHLALARPILEHPKFARPILEHPSLALPAFIPTPVDRTLKGDRGAGIRGAQSNKQLRLPDGCEPRFSVIDRTPANQVARRCVT